MGCLHGVLSQILSDCYIDMDWGTESDSLPFRILINTLWGFVFYGLFFSIKETTKNTFMMQIEKPSIKNK